MNENEIRTYMGYEWINIVDDTLCIGINDDGVAELDEITGIQLPREGDSIVAEEVCGSIESNEGTLELYCPVDGTVVEINGAVLENPKLIVEDPMGDGWIMRIEPQDLDDLDYVDEEEDEE